MKKKRKGGRYKIARVEREPNCIVSDREVATFFEITKGKPRKKKVRAESLWSD